MNARHPHWDTTPQRRALWDHTAARTTDQLIDALMILEAMPYGALSAEHRLTRLVIIDVIERREGIDLIDDEPWGHLWGVDSEQTYGSVLAAAIAEQAAIALVPVARAEAYAAKLVEIGAVDLPTTSDTAILDALAVCGRRPLRAEVPAIRSAYPAQRAAADRDVNYHSVTTAYHATPAPCDLCAVTAPLFRVADDWVCATCHNWDERDAAIAACSFPAVPCPDCDPAEHTAYRAAAVASHA